MAVIDSGSVGLANDYSSNDAGTAYSYRTPEGYGADYGLFGRMGDWFFGTNHAAESAATAYNAEMSNKFNASEAQKNRDFEEYMASTSYQRMFEDAKKAGISPYYLVSKGSSAGSSPAGSAASSSSAPSFGKSKKGKGSAASMASTALSIAKVASILAA